jgi:hypothetical protein
MISIFQTPERYRRIERCRICYHALSFKDSFKNLKIPHSFQKQASESFSLLGKEGQVKSLVPSCRTNLSPFTKDFRGGARL